MRTITVVNNKGGVGKTITSVNVATSLAQRGNKTLLIDLDQQANATSCLIGSGDGIRGIADVFFDGAMVSDVAAPTAYSNLFIVHSGKAFINSEQRLLADQSERSIERRLKMGMKGVNYDYVVIDCPPSLSALITNAMYVATDIIVPCSPDGFSIEGLKVIIDKIQSARQDYAENLERFAIVWTRVDTRQILTKQLIEYLKGKDLPVFETVIRESVKVRESTVQHMPVVVYDPDCNPSKDYQILTTEIVDIAV